MMGICRILGLIGSACGLGLLIWVIIDNGLPDKPFEWFIVVTLSLIVFNLVPIPKSNDRLLSLWIESKKVKLRKEINGD